MSSSVTGVIERAADVDVYSFTAGEGLIHVLLRAARAGSNADREIIFLDATGRTLTVEHSVGGSPATLSHAATPGTYYLRVIAVSPMAEADSVP